MGRGRGIERERTKEQVCCLALMHTRKRTHTLSHTRKYSLARTLMHTRKRTHTLSHTRKYSLARTHKMYVQNVCSVNSFFRALNRLCVWVFVTWANHLIGSKKSKRLLFTLRERHIRKVLFTGILFDNERSVDVYFI